MSSKPQFVGEKQPLENRVDYVRGVTYKAAVDLHEELDDNSYVLLRANNIQDGELRFDDVQYVDRAKVKQKQLLRRGDILFCASSGSKGLVGKAALVRENMPVTFGAFCCVLRPKENEAEYLAHYFQSQQYRRAIEKVCSGSNINNLKAANFFSLVVPHYDDDSTRVISALFDSIDAQIKHAKDQIANLDSLVKSRFVEMFLSSSWPVATIGECATDIHYGTSEKASTEGEHVYLRMNNIGDDGSLDLSDTKRITLEGKALSNCLVRKGDLLFNRTNSREKVGKTCVFCLEEPMVVAGYIIRVRLDDRVDSTYLAAYRNLSSTKALLRGMAKGAVHQANINAKQLASIEFPLADIEAQKEFVAFAQQVDKSRFAGRPIIKILLKFDSPGSLRIARFDSVSCKLV